MTGSGGRAQELDCVVVGGGLAGLACAHDLARAGRSVHVVEAEEAPGGRARTVWHRGRPVDRGFQVLFRAYPRTGPCCARSGCPGAICAPSGGGAVFVDGSGTHRLRRLPAGGRLLHRAGPAGPGQADAPGRRGGRATAADRCSTTARTPASTEEFLRERGSRTRRSSASSGRSSAWSSWTGASRPTPGYFRFLLAMLARGPGGDPERRARDDGRVDLGGHPPGAAGRSSSGVRVEALEPDAQGRGSRRVRMADGRRLAARQVVLAVEAPAARGLLTPLDPAAAGRAARPRPPRRSTAAFALRRPLYRGRTILLNAEPAAERAARGWTSSARRPTSPVPGRRRGRTSCWPPRVTTGGGAGRGLVGRRGGARRPLGARLRLGGPGASRSGSTSTPSRSSGPLPGVRRELPGPRTALENLVLAGDLTRAPLDRGRGRRAAPGRPRS